MSKSKVYFTKEITPQSLIAAYDALGVTLASKIAIKLSTGEAGNEYYLKPELIKDLVSKLEGTIVECNTAYPGKRDTTDAHWQTFKDHGFMDIAPCDLMDEDGEMELEIVGGHHLDTNIVGTHITQYASMLMLSHFKGHPMGGFGGALKNMSIGVASSRGKTKIHTSGNPDGTFEELMAGDHDSFIESMADADKSIIEFYGAENMAYINIANNLSVDCDCVATPEPPEMADLGIFASLDPVAIDAACIDAVYASSDPGKVALIERIESRNGAHILDAAESLGLGSKEYELIEI